MLKKIVQYSVGRVGVTNNNNGEKIKYKVTINLSQVEELIRDANANQRLHLVKPIHGIFKGSLLETKAVVDEATPSE